MDFSWVFAVIPYVFLGCDGFLLDDRNKPSTTSASFLTEQHYNALFNLIVNERQSRAKLQQQLLHLEQELLATQKGVTDIYHTSADNNATLQLEAKNWNTIRTENNDLKNRYKLLEYEFNALARDHSNLENYTKVLEQEVASLQQLKGVTDLQTVLNVRNETKILREELKITNNSLNSLRNDAEARKQDFVALLNKADSTENKLGFSVKTLNDKLKNQQNQTKLEMKLMQDKIQKLGTYQNQTFKHIHENLTAVEGVQKLSVGKLDLQIHSMSNRAALTVCARSKTYSSGTTIIFPYVQTSYGVSSSIRSALGNSGKFKCEKAGLYLISAYLMTGTASYVELSVIKNGYMISALSFPEITAGAKYRTSTFLTMQSLNINDALEIQTSHNVNIYNDRYSCLSILQLSNS
ncbi:unnamed protein product [Mytilus coruscus]|uniref:C1q domain-containing protein n=1 Tax=Mytilus coruscus TaxID=42192 RepID=A0A6J8AA85_MYTCO|nr:unnamed protein product [Mytilus coruscus]